MGLKTFLCLCRSLDKSLWEVPSESFQCRLDDTLTWASDNCHKKIGNGSAPHSMKNPFDIISKLWIIPGFIIHIAISTSAYHKFDLRIRVVLLIEPLQVPDILGVQLLHVLLTGVGDLLGRDRCPHHQCDRLPGNPFMIIFKTTPARCFTLTCVGQFQNCTGRCLDLGRRLEQTQLLKSENPGCSSQRNPPCSPAVRTQTIKKCFQESPTLS